MSFIYLASPYTHKDPQIMHDRYIAAESAMAQMLLRGEPVYCPIAMTHWAAARHNFPKESRWWRYHNYAMLKSANELRVLMMDGWTTSEGVQDEINFATYGDIPITHYKEINGQWVRHGDKT